MRLYYQVEKSIHPILSQIFDRFKARKRNFEKAKEFKSKVLTLLQVPSKQLETLGERIKIWMMLQEFKCQAEAPQVVSFQTREKSTTQKKLPQPRTIILSIWLKI